jgi:hypothetical protein
VVLLEGILVLLPDRRHPAPMVVLLEDFLVLLVGVPLVDILRLGFLLTLELEVLACHRTPLMSPLRGFLTILPMVVVGFDASPGSVPAPPGS